MPSRRTTGWAPLTIDPLDRACGGDDGADQVAPPSRDVRTASAASRRSTPGSRCPGRGSPGQLSQTIQSLSGLSPAPEAATTGARQATPSRGAADDDARAVVAQHERGCEPRRVPGVVGDGRVARALVRALPAATRPSRRAGGPTRHEWPASRDVEKPVAAAPPPSRARPTWKTATIVRPSAKLSGSASVWCWYSKSPKGSCESSRETVSQSTATASPRPGRHRVGTCAARDVVPRAVSLRRR